MPDFLNQGAQIFYGTYVGKLGQEGIKDGLWIFTGYQGCLSGVESLRCKRTVIFRGTAP